MIELPAAAPPPEDPPPPWLVACLRHAEGRGLPGSCVEVLRAFPTGDTSGEGLSFEALHREDAAAADEVTRGIATELAREVDPDQAAMFSRRFAAVLRTLDDLAGRSGEARVLLVGLVRRVRGILDGQAPRVVRVRACIDFYAGHAARVLHRVRLGGRPVPEPADRVREARWTPVDEGVEHARVAGDTSEGPLRANLLRVAGRTLRAVPCHDDPDAARDFGAWASGRGAVAATSGGFFLYSETDIHPPERRHDPVGLLVDRGRILVPPALRRTALLQCADGRILVRRVGPVGARVGWKGSPARGVYSCNDPSGERTTAYNRAWGLRSPMGPSQVAVAAGRVVAAGSGPLPIPLGGLVLDLDQGPVPQVGTEVSFGLDPRLGRVWFAMAGGPRLLRDGVLELDLAADDLAGTAPPVTFSTDETFDQNLLPRLAAGVDDRGRLVVCAVDGRDLERAPGTTLRGVARLLEAAGCTEGVNLDGGSSKRMAVAGRVVDLPSTEVVAGDPPAGPPRVRPVHTAILVL